MFYSHVLEYVHVQYISPLSFRLLSQPRGQRRLRRRCCRRLRLRPRCYPVRRGLLSWCLGNSKAIHHHVRSACQHIPTAPVPQRPVRSRPERKHATGLLQKQAVTASRRNLHNRVVLCPFLVAVVVRVIVVRVVVVRVVVVRL